MSRCLPFPPPGYVWNGVSGDALVELLQDRQEKAQAEKERTKQKRKRHNNGSRKKKVRETQGLEDSSLTEETRLHITSDSQYDSSDNTRNIKKIKPIVRAEVAYNEPFCHTPAKPSSSSETSPSLHREPGHSCYRSTEERLAEEKAKRVLASSFSHIESKFREVIENWIPPRTQFYHDTDFDDQDWLYERKLPRLDVTEKSKASNDDSCCRSLKSSTCATYLPQARVHVLPFTLLF